MAERVSTGGTKNFVYKKGDIGKLDEERKRGIEKGYQEYYERKARERKNRDVLILIIVLVLIALGIWFLF